MDFFSKKMKKDINFLLKPFLREKEEFFKT